MSEVNKVFVYCLIKHVRIAQFLFLCVYQRRTANTI